MHSSTRPDEKSTEAAVSVAQGVLVINDDDTQREWLSRILIRSGVTTVFTATGSEEALQCLRTSAAGIGLLICDLQMPGVDGMALLRRIGEAGYNPAVIISSGSDPAILRSVELMVKAFGLNVLGSLPACWKLVRC